MRSQLVPFEFTYRIVLSSFLISPTKENERKEKRKKSRKKTMKKKKKKISAAIKCIVTWASRTSKLVVKLTTMYKKRGKAKLEKRKILEFARKSHTFLPGKWPLKICS